MPRQRVKVHLHIVIYSLQKSFDFRDSRRQRHGECADLRQHPRAEHDGDKAQGENTDISKYVLEVVEGGEEDNGQQREHYDGGIPAPNVAISLIDDHWDRLHIIWVYHENDCTG